MRRSMFILSAVAPFTLLAACGGGDPSEAGDGAAGDTTVPAATATPAAMPAIAPNARTSVMWEGTYRGTGPTGEPMVLTLTPDMTYTLNTGTATPVTGKFNWYRDGQRILLDGAGGKLVLGVADGALYRMASTEASVMGPFERSAMMTKQR